MNANLAPTQWVGLAGVAALFVGVFTPLYSIMGFTVTMSSIGWPAAVTGIAALTAAVFIVRRQGWWTLGAGLAALGVALYLFMRMQMGITDVVNEIQSSGEVFGEWGETVTEGIGQVAEAALSPSWGWAIVGLGIGAVMFAGIAQVLTDRRHA